jgi:hypothetical protein
MNQPASQPSDHQARAKWRWQFSLRHLLLLTTTVAVWAYFARDIASAINLALAIGVACLAAVQLMAALCIHWQLETTKLRARLLVSLAIWASIEWLLLVMLLAIGNRELPAITAWRCVVILLSLAVMLLLSAWRRRQKSVAAR